MIIEQGSSHGAEWELRYDVHITNNKPVRTLFEVSYQCRCGKCAYVDMRIVPVQDLDIHCDVCDNRVLTLEWWRFEQQLIPLYPNVDDEEEEYHGQCSGSD